MIGKDTWHWTPSISRPHLFLWFPRRLFVIGIIAGAFIAVAAAGLMVLSPLLSFLRILLRESFHVNITEGIATQRATTFFASRTQRKQLQKFGEMMSNPRKTLLTDRFSAFWVRNGISKFLTVFAFFFQGLETKRSSSLSLSTSLSSESCRFFFFFFLFFFFFFGVLVCFFWTFFDFRFCFWTSKIEKNLTVWSATHDFNTVLEPKIWHNYGINPMFWVNFRNEWDITVPEGKIWAITWQTFSSAFLGLGGSEAESSSLSSLVCLRFFFRFKFFCNLQCCIQNCERWFSHASNTSAWSRKEGVLLAQ